MRITTNNSHADVYDIGEGDEAALLCITNLVECCYSSDTPIGVGGLGEWFYPNGSTVPIEGAGYDLYRNRGPSVVRLNRRRNGTSPTGLYCCEVPDSTFTTQRVCANIGGYYWYCACDYHQGDVSYIQYGCMMFPPLSLLHLLLL